MTRLPDQSQVSSTSSRYVSHEGLRLREGERFQLGSAGGTLETRSVQPGDTLASLVEQANPGAAEDQLEALAAMTREANGFASDLIPGPRSSVLVAKLDAAALPEGPTATGGAQGPRGTGAALPADRGVRLNPTAQEKAQRTRDQAYVSSISSEPPRPEPQAETPEQIQRGTDVLKGLLARAQERGKPSPRPAVRELLPAGPRRRPAPRLPPAALSLLPPGRWLRALRRGKSRITSPPCPKPGGARQWPSSLPGAP